MSHMSKLPKIRKTCKGVKSNPSPGMNKVTGEIGGVIGGDFETIFEKIEK